MEKRKIKILLSIFIFSIFIIFFVPVLSQERFPELKNISKALASDISNSGKKLIAVVDFTDLEGNVTLLGRLIAEELSSFLSGMAKSFGFEVIDRIHLRVILAEHKLSTTGIIDPTTSRRLGEIVGVDALVTGTLTSFSESVRIIAKILDVNTAKIIGSTSTDIPRTEAIKDIETKEIEKEKGVGQPFRPSSATSPTPKAQQTAEVKGLLFEILSCRLSGGNVQCQILITNKLDDRIISLHNEEIIMYDNFGNRYIADTGIKIGNISQRLYRYLDAKLIMNIPTKMVANFSNVSPDASYISVLEIRGSIQNEGLYVQFRNIPLSK